jgi:hypothetical protein
VTSLGAEPKAAISDLKFPTGHLEVPAVADQPDSTTPAHEPARFDVKKSFRAVRRIPAEPALKAKPAGGLLYLRVNASSDTFGRLAVASINALDKAHYLGELSCARVHFGGGTGVCVAREVISNQGRDQIGFADAFRSWLMSFTGYSAVMFNEQLQPGWSIKLNGLPSRVRVSPSGRLAAITVFLSGHSYASLKFSTQTTIIDVGSGKVLTDLETFSVTRSGEAFQSPDFNFWGVTFAHDENHFYATLWSKGKTYLVECDLAKHMANVIYEGVECPSLSPDNTRIAFKKRTVAIGVPITWRICLLDLKTLTDTPLGETRSIDDQVEWLDNDHVLYAFSENESGSSASADIWVLPADPNGSPRLLLKGAFSPAVVPSTN